MNVLVFTVIDWDDDDPEDKSWTVSVDNYEPVPRRGEWVMLGALHKRRLLVHEVVHHPFGTTEHPFPHTAITLRGTTSG